MICGKKVEGADRISAEFSGSGVGDTALQMQWEGLFVIMRQTNPVLTGEISCKMTGGLTPLRGSSAAADRRGGFGAESDHCVRRHLRWGRGFGSRAPGDFARDGNARHTR